jgi:hypothetical protein
MYNFTNFAMSLNELEPGMQDRLAPTDCRLRPDIRAMENGDMGIEVLLLHPHTLHDAALYRSSGVVHSHVFFVFRFHCCFLRGVKYVSATYPQSQSIRN